MAASIYYYCCCCCCCCCCWYSHRTSWWWVGGVVCSLPSAPVSLPVPSRPRLIYLQAAFHRGSACPALPSSPLQVTTTHLSTTFTYFQGRPVVSPVLCGCATLVTLMTRVIKGLFPPRHSFTCTTNNARRRSLTAPSSLFLHVLMKELIIDPWASMPSWT